MNLKESIVSSYIAFENELSGRTNTPVHKQRSEAFDVFEKKGFPTIKEEEWKYTNLIPVTRHDYAIMPRQEYDLKYSDVKPYLFHEMDTYRLVFLDGVFSAWLSNTSSDKFQMACLCDELDLNTEVIQNHFNQYAKTDESMTALNTAFAVEGALIRVPDNVVVEKPIEIVYLATDKGKDIMVQPRNLIVVGKNAQVRIIERHRSLGSNNVFNNSVTEVFADKDAIVDLYKIQSDTEKSSLIDNTFIEQKHQAQVNVFTFSLGGKFVRNNLKFSLREEHSHARLFGFTLLNEKEFADHHTLVDHIVPNCESTELYRGIYDDHSHGVFNGKVKVFPDAQKTNAFQQNNNVLLTDYASIDTKPELEIYADDVKCSHGCTVGQLDEEALFYLRSRGIPEREAIAMLLLAFKQDVVKEIKSETIRKRINRMIADKLKVEIDMDI